MAAKVLVVGGGGREHALLWRLSQSAEVGELFATPGNGGICQEATCVSGLDNKGIVDFATSRNIDLAVIGPEAYLVSGLADDLRARGIPTFGPSAAGAALEGSKSFAKNFMKNYGIPTARAEEVTDFEEAKRLLRTFPQEVVIKADGLAAGKGVTVASNHNEAAAALRECLVDNKFGSAGSRVLIEERLEGHEVSLLVLTDGKEIVPLPSAQDYKRLGDGDTGPNTGGMGCYSPVPAFSPNIYETAIDTIILPTVRALDKEGIAYSGVLYAGLMLTAEGPKVLEFNARFGDPETQAVIPRLESDLYELLLRAASASLSGVSAEWSNDRCVSVVLASRGYPENPETGKVVSGLEAAALDRVNIFHAGTTLADGRVYTSSGRVFNVSALARSFADARKLAYQACDRIEFDGKYYRRDIAETAERSEAMAEAQT